MVSAFEFMFWTSVVVVASASASAGRGTRAPARRAPGGCVGGWGARLRVTEGAAHGSLGVLVAEVGEACEQQHGRDVHAPHLRPGPRAAGRGRAWAGRAARRNGSGAQARAWARRSARLLVARTSGPNPDDDDASAASAASAAAGARAGAATATAPASSACLGCCARGALGTGRRPAAARAPAAALAAATARTAAIASRG